MILIPLSQGRFSLVDDEDADLLARRWAAQADKGNFYAVRTNITAGKRKGEKLHQVIARRMGIEGAPDHRNRCGLDNRRENLRQATQAQNCANRGPRKDNKAGFKGVRMDRGRWRAHIGPQRRCLGYFASAEEAARAYDAAALERYGEFAYLNFPAAHSKPGSEGTL